MMMRIYKALMEDDVINDLVDGRIKFYEYPEAKDMTETHIIIDPLDPPKPGDFADNKWLTEDYLLQIDVWSKSMEERDLIAKTIQDVLWDNLGFRQYGGNGLDEWNKEFEIFRDARRYRGKVYREDLDSL